MAALLAMAGGLLVVRLLMAAKEKRRMAQEQREGQSPFEGATMQETGQQAPPTCSRRVLWKVAVVVVLVVAVAGVIASKHGKGTPTAQEPSVAAEAPQARPAGTSEALPDPATVLATVNGEPITHAQVEEALQALPDQYRGMFERSRQDLLEELIARKLLLQEARSKGFMAADVGGSPDRPASAERGAIQELLQQEVLGGLDVSGADVEEFYEQHKDEMPAGRTFEELQDSLRSYALQEKQNGAVESYLAKLRAAATITRNESWVEAQKARAADNPLDQALATGRAVAADFGRGQCIPCKLMKPILDDLQAEYAGRAEILIIDIDDFPALTQRLGIRAIPTQIFYDAQGKEVYRHQGFMPREDIVARLAAMGVK